MSDDVLVVFTPSGKRGRVAQGTTVLQAARELGVDLDSVCGGRAICGRCQVTLSEGAFPKHGIESRADHLSGLGDNEIAYDEVEGLAEGRRLGCSARLLNDAVIDVPPARYDSVSVVIRAPRAFAASIFESQTSMPLMAE